MRNHIKTALFMAAASLLLAGADVSVQADSQVAINDSNFAWAIKEYAVEADDNGDSMLSAKEAAEVTRIHLDSSQNIDSFRGIEYFTNLKDFFYRANTASTETDDYRIYAASTASELNLSGMKKLNRVRIICSNSYLKTVDLGDCTKLKEVSIRGRESVDNLNLRGCTNLRTVDCSDITVEKLNLSKLNKLETVTVNGDRMQNLNLNKCYNLESVNAGGDSLIKLKLKGDKKLESLNVGAPSMMILDLSTNTGLKDLYLSDVKIPSPDLSDNRNLTQLNCYQTGILSLDLRENKKLTEVDCHNNKNMAELKVKGCTKLKILRCYNTALTKLNVTKNPNLKNLHCKQTAISKLNLKNNKKLRKLICSETNIRELDLSNTNIHDASGLECDDTVAVTYAD